MFQFFIFQFVSPSFFGLYFTSFLSTSFNCSINVNFAGLLKLRPVNRKCWPTWSKFCLFMSFRQLFSLKSKVVSDLPMYCLLHNTHSIRYIRYLFFQLSLLYILRVLYVTVLLKVFVQCTCVQHIFFNLDLLQITILINILTQFLSIIDDYLLAKNILQISVSSEGYYREFCKNLFKTSFLIYLNTYLPLFLCLEVYGYM